MWGVLITCVVVVAVVAQNENARLVNIRQGPVRGYRKNDTDVFAFYGIPYATAPTGAHKFRPAYPPPEWTEPLEAVDHSIVCIQPMSPISTSKMQEDCLVTNVFVPKTEEINLPVVVIVHGGAFQYGFGGDLPIALVNSKRIIAVTFNYRLGAHGFLCLGTQDISGNAGIKDQVALLRWVRENIANFGGNPDDVTISGCSAGGASVDMLTLSPMAEGLFNKVIAGSGGNAGSFGIQIDPYENAKNYARLLNFDNVDDANALEEFYKTASYDTLLSGIDQIMGRTDSTVWFAPCVETETGNERFLEDAPVNILKKKDLKRYPKLYGYANMEGLIRIDLFNLWSIMMNDNFSDFLPADLEFSSVKEKEEVARTVKEFYFGDELVSDSNILTYIDYFTDVLFGYSMLRSLRLHSEHSNNLMYLYEFSFVDINSFLVPNTDERGANHCDQWNIVMDEEKSLLTPEYINMKEVMRELWLNFITTGKPVPEGSYLPEWPPAGTDRSPHMSINSTMHLLGPLAQSRAEFWDSIYEKYYKTPVPPRSAASQFSPTLFMFLAIKFVCINYL